MVKNRIENIKVDYITPTRSVEIIKVSNNLNSKIFFIYNFEGNYFRLFENTIDLISFFENQTDNYVDFKNDEDLDKYLINLVLS